VETTPAQAAAGSVASAEMGNEIVGNEVPDVTKYVHTSSVYHRFIIPIMNWVCPYQDLF
jgi:hypothetical protein